MSKTIEIYLRPSGERLLLNLYVPKELKKLLVAGLKDGSFDGKGTPMYVEFTVLPEWVGDNEATTTSPAHVRMPLSAIKLIEGE